MLVSPPDLQWDSGGGNDAHATAVALAPKGFHGSRMSRRMPLVSSVRFFRRLTSSYVLATKYISADLKDLDSFRKVLR